MLKQCWSILNFVIQKLILNKKKDFFLFFYFFYFFFEKRGLSQFKKMSLPTKLENICGKFVENLKALGITYNIPQNGPKTIAEYIQILSEIQKEFDYVTIGTQPEEEKEYFKSNTKRERSPSPPRSPLPRSPSPRGRRLRSPSKKKKSASLSPRSRRIARQKKEGFGIFIRYAHDGIGEKEVVYNVAHHSKDRKNEQNRLHDIFSKYGTVIENETEVWEQLDNYYGTEVPMARVFFKDTEARRAALADANQIEEKYRFRIMINDPPRRKKY